MLPPQTDRRRGKAGQPPNSCFDSQRRRELASAYASKGVRLAVPIAPRGPNEARHLVARRRSPPGASRSSPAARGRRRKRERPLTRQSVTRRRRRSGRRRPTGRVRLRPWRRLRRDRRHVRRPSRRVAMGAACRRSSGRWDRRSGPTRRRPPTAAVTLIPIRQRSRTFAPRWSPTERGPTTPRTARSGCRRRRSSATTSPRTSARDIGPTTATTRGSATTTGAGRHFTTAAGCTAAGPGWEWIPGREYAGAWVSWRYGVDDWAYVGWAPLAPTWCWRGGVAVGIGFVPRAPYAFVGTGELFAPRVGARVVVGAQVGAIASHTRPYVPASPSGRRSRRGSPRRRGPVSRDSAHRARRGRLAPPRTTAG